MESPTFGELTDEQIHFFLTEDDWQLQLVHFRILSFHFFRFKIERSISFSPFTLFSVNLVKIHIARKLYLIFGNCRTLGGLDTTELNEPIRYGEHNPNQRPVSR